MPFDARTDPATGPLSISVSGTVSCKELERMFDEIMPRRPKAASGHRPRRPIR